MSIDHDYDTPRSLPVEPLAILTGHPLPKEPPGRWSRDTKAEHEKQRTFADHLGVHISTVRRWMIEGVPISRADEVACSAGFHPMVVWPDLWEAAEDARIAKRSTRDHVQEHARRRELAAEREMAR